MAERSYQGQPLSPVAYRVSSDDNSHSTPVSTDYFKSFKSETRLRRRRCIVKCCGCITALFLITAVIALALILTVFHVKAPRFEINSIAIKNLKFTNGTLFTDDHSSVTLVAGVSVKNPNYMPFRLANTTTNVYYHGVSIGQGWSPWGRVKARETMETNVTIDIVSNKILEVPNWSTDASFGEMELSSYTEVSGRVHVIRTIHKHLVVNCTMTVNLTSLEVRDINCHRRAALVED